MLLIDGIQIEADKMAGKSEQEGLSLIKKRVCEICGISNDDIVELDIHKKSIDARKKPDVFYNYSVVINTSNDDRILKGKSKHVRKYWPKKYQVNIGTPLQKRPIVVGFGPAGIAAAYLLAKKGMAPLVIERGASVDERKKKVEGFWNTGLLDEKTNVQFGEGGAGAFSDGKLNTGNKDKDGLQRLILKTLCEFGAPGNIVYDAKPHIGTDILCEVVKNIRKEIIRLGGEFLFNTKLVQIVTQNAGDKTKVAGIVIEQGKSTRQLGCDRLILAIGHSARDTFGMLKETNVPLEAKPFAIGYRVAHRQEFINLSQYGKDYEKKKLPPAVYKLTHQLSSGRSMYSFCMCPGGYIVNASSKNRGLCVNGMSYSDRAGEYANAAMILSVLPQEIYGLIQSKDGISSDDPLRGMYLMEEIEKRAYECGGGKIPVCTLGGYKEPGDFNEEKIFKGSTNFIPDMIESHKILPRILDEDFKAGMTGVSKYIKGFDSDDTIVAGVESRTSSPIRITRGDNNAAIGIEGLYPCGEGAGYAGGIMSAAMDGIRTVSKMFLQII